MKKNLTLLYFGALVCTSLLLSANGWAHNGELFRDEISKVESLLTGGYMRLGLLGVCGVTAIMGAINQNSWMFIISIFGGLFAFFMKDWVLTTFACLI